MINELTANRADRFMHLTASNVDLYDLFCVFQKYYKCLKYGVLLCLQKIFLTAHHVRQDEEGDCRFLQGPCQPNVTKQQAFPLSFSRSSAELPTSTPLSE